MTKNAKGITLISFAITVIVMLIILGVTLVSGTSLLEHSRLTKIETSLLLIKAKAETLAEQFDFDGNVESVLNFSVLDNNGLRPTVFNYGTNVNSLAYRGNNGTVFWVNSNNTAFNDLVKKIYGTNFSENITVKTWTGLNYVGINIDRFLYVKWGLNECISHGIVKEDDDGNKIFDNNDKYAIVQYDLKNGSVPSISYSPGFRNKNGVIEYTLSDLLQIDIDGD